MIKFHSLIKKIIRILAIVAAVYTVVFVLFVYMLINPIFLTVEPIKVDIPVNIQRLYTDVKKLTSVQPSRSIENRESLNEISIYIEDQFKKLDCRIQIQPFKVAGKEYTNVIASFGPGEGERLIVGAHYDVYGDQPGADDNASGVAGLLELGRIIHQLKPQLRYRVDLVAYSLEEAYFNTPWMGSAAHAQSLVDEGVKVKCMICLEMIGYFSEEPGSQGFPVSLFKAFYPTKGNFIAVVGKLWDRSLVKNIKIFMLQVADIDVCSINAPAALWGANLSDHLNYWKNGFDAVMITDTAFLRNHNYHRVTDTIHTLNFQKMAEVVKGVYWTIVSL